jgi:endogenous inhibitor of DNA gyrase (YacG/DUF329 family)
MAANEFEPGTDRAPAERCPICGKPALERVRPFCSRRCADVDLNRWLTGAYAIPVVDDEDEEAHDESPRGVT